ncbi:MAG: hypothetical protein RL065_1992 [Bacteroidota bacterium]|jgi:hypothetical protein
MNNLIALVNQLEQNISYFEKSNLKFSSANVGWQIEHSLLTIDRIIMALEKSNPELFKKKFNFSKFRVFLFNKIPRGKAKAPKIVTPQSDINSASLKNHIETTIKNIHQLNYIQPNHFFSHPYFGDLIVKDAINFLEIHTQHHLFIIQDIIRK